jgi:hypothetical protein
MIRKWQQDDVVEDMENQVEKNIVNRYNDWNNRLLEQMLLHRLHSMQSECRGERE